MTGHSTRFEGLGGVGGETHGDGRLAFIVRAVLPLLQSPLERARPPDTRSRLISTLFGRASNVLMVAVAAAICGTAAWVRGGGWIAAFIAGVEVAILLARCGVIIAFGRAIAARKPVDPESWLVLFGVLAIGSSISWGALCFVCLAFSHDPVLYAIPVLSTVGTAGAVAARNSGVPRLAKIQLACSLVPILPGCLLTDDVGYRLLLLLVPAMVAGLLILITERNQQLVDLIETQAELARLSQTDPLTQVPNRRYFDARLEAVVAEATRSSQPFALLMVDVDHFKAFNDRYGHLAGDILLRAIAAILTGNVRGGDDLVARYGGEEFAILLPDSDRHEAIEIAERLRRAVHTSRVNALDPDPVTISVGVTIASGRADTNMVIGAADAALYRAKRAGRNRVEVAGLHEARPERGIPAAA